MRRDGALRLLKVGAAGALLACAFPPVALPVLLPAGIALLVGLLEEPGLSVRRAAYTGLFFGLVLYAITLPWLFNLFGPAAISLLFIAAAFPMLFSGLYVWLRRRMPSFPLWLLAALLWTGVEYFRSEPFWLSFGWMGLGYGAVENPFSAAAASVLGSYGVSFLIVAGAAAYGTTPLRGLPRTGYRAALALFWLALFVAPMLLPHQKPEPNNPMSVRLVQSRAGEPEESIRLSTSRNAVPVDVILWPEYSVLDDPTRDKKLWAKVQQLARSQLAYVIFGGKHVTGSEAAAYRNTAFVLDRDGKLVGTHVKNHTVHFIQDGIRGTEARPVETSLGKLGVAICFDMDYPDVARRLVQQGAEVFLVPNMDPDEWGELQRTQHRLTFQMRAAECGRWLARADVAGGTSVAAPNGREVERIDTAEPKAMEVIIGREQGKTIYLRGGWLFGPACFWVVVGLVGLGLVRKRKLTAD